MIRFKHGWLRTDAINFTLTVFLHSASPPVRMTCADFLTNMDQWEMSTFPSTTILKSQGNIHSSHSPSPDANFFANIFRYASVYSITCHITSSSTNQGICVRSIRGYPGCWGRYILREGPTFTRTRSRGSVRWGRQKDPRNDETEVSQLKCVIITCNLTSLWAN